MVTAAMKLKRHLLLGRKAMINLDSILKSRDITLPTNVHLVKAMVFPVVMYGCESWTVKKAECFLDSPTLISIHDHWKTIALARWTFVGKVIPLLLNILSRLVITFLPRSIF